MKLKTYKTFTKQLRRKIRNQKNKYWSWNTNNKKNQVERSIDDKLDNHNQHASHH